MENRSSGANAQSIFLQKFNELCADLGPKADLETAQQRAKESIKAAQSALLPQLGGPRLIACRTMFAAVLEGVETLAAADAEAELVKAAPKFTPAPAGAGKKSGLSTRWIVSAVCAVSVLMCVMICALNSKQPGVFVFGRIALLFTILWAAIEFVTRKRDAILKALKIKGGALAAGAGQREEPPYRARARRMVDIGKLRASCERQMALIDQNLPSFSNENPSAGDGASVPPVIVKLMDAYCAEDIQLNEQVLDTVAEELRAKGMTYLLYSPERAAYFDTVVKSETFTMEPAYVSLDGKHIVRKGRAAVKGEER